MIDADRLRQLEAAVQRWARAYRGAWPSSSWDQQRDDAPSVSHAELRAAERALLDLAKAGGRA